MTAPTTAKGNYKPKRVSLVCPACGKRFSLMPSEARKVENGTRGPCCGHSCGQQFRREKVAEVPA